LVVYLPQSVSKSNFIEWAFIFFLRALTLTPKLYTITSIKVRGSFLLEMYYFFFFIECLVMNDICVLELEEKVKWKNGE
jgi:hypothetical protein